MDLYIITNLSGDISELLHLQNKYKISSSQIILAGNFIGRHGCQEILSYLMQHNDDYRAILSGGVEKKFIFSDTDSFPTKLQKEYFAIENKRLADFQKYLSMLPDHYKEDNFIIIPNDKYDLGNGIFRPACSIVFQQPKPFSLLEETKIVSDTKLFNKYYLPDERIGFSGIKIISK